METPKVFESEYRFCQILWDNEPVRSSELVRLCREKLGWKQSTTYTVIKRLSERGVLENNSSVVRSLVSQEQVQKEEINELIDRRFNGSIPSFLAAFTDSHALSDDDLDEIQQMIDTIRKGK
ncbi:MAG: BlaI/MecI/CopY family transcriptional regulator [Bulleidia sp.]